VEKLISALQRGGRFGYRHHVAHAFVSRARVTGTPAGLVFIDLSVTSACACVSALKTLGISDEALYEVTTAVANEAATRGATQYC